MFRLELDDGRHVTLRQFKTAAAASEVWRLLNHRRTSALPRPLLQITRALVVEYVEGVRLDRHLSQAGPAEERRQIRAAGELLAQLHRGAPPRGYVRSMSEYKRLLTRMMRRLARQRRLDSKLAERLAGIEPPGKVRIARTHGDLSPVNLIVTAANGLRAIDVERLAARPVAFDLARTVALWPLTAKQERDLITAYQDGGGRPDHYLAHRSFWTAVALATSTAFRLVYKPDSLRPIVTNLRRLAATID